MSFPNNHPQGSINAVRSIVNRPPVLLAARRLGLQFTSVLALVVACGAATVQLPPELSELDTKLQAPTAVAGEALGRSVALRGDVAVVGIPDAGDRGDASGAVQLFMREEDQWMPAERLVAADGTAGARFGSQVAINEAGDTIVIANGFSARGAVYVFTRQGEDWIQEIKLSVAVDFYGTTADISGETIVVGAWGENSLQIASGAAYVYVREASGWTLQQKLKQGDPGIDDNFGWSVAISGNSIVVGAPFDDIGGSNAGSAYVFGRAGTTWSQLQRLNAVDRNATDWFGLNVEIGGDWLFVAAPNDDDRGSDSGSVYAYSRAGGAWVFEGVLRSSDAGASDQLGGALAVNATGDALLLGASAKASNRGAAYLFVRTENTWNEARNLTPVGLSASDRYGQGVAIEGGTFFIGASGDDDNAEDAGAVYVWEPSSANDEAIAEYLGAQLYYSEAQTSGRFDPNTTAFRYKDLLYGIEENKLRARFERMETLYGAPERELAEAAETEIWSALSRNPTSASLTQLLLDVYYDRAAAETIYAKTLFEQAESARILAVPAGTGFVIDSEIDLYQQALATNRFALASYLPLLTRELLIQPPPAEPEVHWATSVLGFSTEYTDSSWAAIQTLGEPDTYPRHGDISSAWASTSSDGQREFLELGYDPPLPVDSVAIYETYNPGAVDKVSVRNADTGEWVEVWSGQAAAAGTTARIFTVAFPLTSYPVDAVRIDIDSPAVPSWNEIDAVGIFATPPSAPEPTLDPEYGYHLFRDLVPLRALEPAQYTNTTGELVTVVTNEVLATGYKDLVLLFDLLRDQGQITTTLGRLHLANGQLDAARGVVQDAQRELLLQGQTLLQAFPDLVLDEGNDPSGLSQSVAGWQTTLDDLADLKVRVRESANLLGFEDDFLMLVQKFQGQDPELFDSFNSFKEWLDPNLQGRHLRYALDRLAAAREAYTVYRNYEDQMRDQFEQSTISYDFRLFEIVGARPGEPGYDTPGAIVGSEIWQQTNSMGIAQLRIDKNQVEIDNLSAEIQIEINKAQAISNVVVAYGDRQAELTEEISHINAAQAAAKAYADAFSIEKLNPVNIFFNAVNAGVQTGGELAKGEKEAEKERLAAAEQAQIVGIENAAHVKILWLGMRTLALDSQEALLLMQQEVGRLAALLREKADLERRIAERNSELSTRYFADPVHRLRSLYELEVGNLAFDEAHKWLFFMVRALEYKWNNPFVHTFEGQQWTRQSIFKLRQADELLSFYRAMVDYDGLVEGTRRKDDYYDWFSVREDFLGFRRVDDQGELLFYTDPQTGETVDAIEAFRRHLRSRQDELGQVRLEFSTVRQLPGGTFFRGARFLPNGQVDPDQRGLYLDKIRWLKIRLPGTHNVNRNRTFIAGSLTYGGSSYIRNERVGQLDPERPDRLVNEWTPYSTRYYYLSQARTETLPGVDNMPPIWQFREALTDPAVQMWLTSDARVEGSAQQVDVLPSVQEIEAFKERSVAASRWRLIVPTTDLGQTLLNLDELEDIEIYFYHYAVVRP